VFYGAGQSRWNLRFTIYDLRKLRGGWDGGTLILIKLGQQRARFRCPVWLTAAFEDRTDAHTTKLAYEEDSQRLEAIGGCEIFRTMFVIFNIPETRLVFLGLPCQKGQNRAGAL